MAGQSSGTKMEAEGRGDNLAQKIRLVEAAPVLAKRVEWNGNEAKLVILPEREQVGKTSNQLVTN